MASSHEPTALALWSYALRASSISAKCVSAHVQISFSNSLNVWPNGVRAYSTRGGTTWWTVRFTSPSRSKFRSVRVSIFWEIPLISRFSSPCRFIPNANAYRTSAVHFSERRSSTCREPYFESNTVGCEYSFVSTSFTSFISLRHFQVPTYQVREYHVIVSLAERDVNTCLGMEQRPQRDDKTYVEMHRCVSDESDVPMCKGSD